MKDVSRHSGVSVATVSNVITGKHAVSEKARKKVEQAIKELGYQVNLVARGLKTQRTNTIGVILPDITKLFFQKVINGILDAAYAKGYMIHILGSGYSFHTERELIRALQSSCVDGILLDSCVSIDNSADWAAELTASDTNMPPVVSIESKLDPSRISSVTVDNALYSGSITQHLIDSGKKSIYYVSGPLHLEHEYARYLGFRDCILKNGLPLRLDLQKSGAYLSESGYVAVKQALEAGLTFDAVQASNDQAAIGALKVLNEYHLRVPEDVAVCGFDNLFPSTLVSPAITTVDVPAYELGASAVHELVRRIGDPECPPTTQVLGARIVIRASSRKNVPCQWDLSNW
jgi:DNA-binding LacI/PurR family transcriptional regulator